MDQDPRPSERSIMRELVPDWRPARRQVLWTIRIVLGLVVVLSILTLVGWPFDVTLWNWLELLIIPVVLAIGGLLFTRSENRATQAAAERRAQDEALQAYLDHISQLLLERDLRASSFADEVRMVARAQIMSVLGRLGPQHKRSLVLFLYEQELCTYKAKRPPVFKRVVLGDEESEKANAPTVELYGADLSEADLSGVTLKNVNLDFADLTDANLCRASFAELVRYLSDEELESFVPSPGFSMLNEGRRAILIRDRWTSTETPWKELDPSWEPEKVASLFHATLRNANLNDAVLAGVDLAGAVLTEARLQRAFLQDARLYGASLAEANLAGANLSGADLRDAKLSGALLLGADLSGAQGITNEKLEHQADVLEGATMPNGQKYEVWLKEKEQQGG